MSFNVHKKHQWELVRYCQSQPIIGGAEKLLKAFVDEYSPKSIISFCDIAKFTGGVYKKLGFKLDHINEPRFVWSNKNEKNPVVLSRRQCQRHKLERLFGEQFPKEMSEKTIMESKGFVRLFDCGNQAWIWCATCP